MQRRLAQYNHNTVTKHLQEVARNTTTAVSQHTRSITRYLSFLGTRILSKLDFVSRLGNDVKESTTQILGMMFTMSGDLRAVVLRLDKGIDNGEHFVLEDATGRPIPIHLRTISSWEALDFILSDRFKGRKGERRIKRKLFSLHESASNMGIDRSARFEDAFVPYQKCKASAPLQADSIEGLSSCPWCKTLSSGEVGSRVKCSNCKRDFIRVLIEAEEGDESMFRPSAPTPHRVFEVQFGKPSFDAGRKRARDEDSDEEGGTCKECHQEKKAKKEKSDERRTKGSEEDESDEENLTGWAHVELQMKRTRLTETKLKPFQAVQTESFDAMARNISGDSGAVFVTIGSAVPVYGDNATFGNHERDLRVMELSSSDEDEPDDVSMYSEENDDKPMRRPRASSLSSVVSDAMATTSEDTSMDTGSGSTDVPNKEGPAPTEIHTPRSPSAKPATQTGPKAQRKPSATEEDAKKHRIPEGYSLKNWNPTEEPILLLGSAFDANSLGNWIFDWTVFRFGAGHPILELAGDLWTSLIQLSEHTMRAEKVMPCVRRAENRECLEDFIESGKRMMNNLRKLLKECETPMLKAQKSPPLGKNAGIAFVETMFGLSRELEKTKRWISSVDLWVLRFDANCEEILRNPKADFVL